MSSSPFLDFLEESQTLQDPDDPAQGVVKVRTTQLTYCGRVVSVKDEGLLTLDCVDEKGDSAPYPVHLDLSTVVSARYADLDEADVHSYTGALSGNGPV